MYRFILLLIMTVSICLGGCATSVTPEGKPAIYHYQMGLSYLEERNYTSALIDLTTAEKIEADIAELQYNLGRALVGKRRLDLAEKKFLRAIELKPDYSLARNDLGVLYMDTAQWDNAIAQFKAVKDDLFYPRHEHAMINLGLAYLGKRDYKRALDELYAARAVDPRNPITKVAIGRVLFAQGKTEQAIVEYQRALEIVPEYAAAHYYLGLALMKTSRLAEAKIAFSEVVKLAPDTEIGRISMSYTDRLR